MDCGLLGDRRSVVDAWSTTEDKAALFFMAATAWDLMLTPEETTKKQRGVDFDELKKSVRTIHSVFVHLCVSVVNFAPLLCCVAPT